MSAIPRETERKQPRLKWEPTAAIRRRTHDEEVEVIKGHIGRISALLTQVFDGLDRLKVKQEQETLT